MSLSLKQFVPSEVCLKCNGCCRYKQADSVWRPKLGENDRQHLGTSEVYIETIPSGPGHLCRFLNSADNTCSVYAQRPFECALYPFILSQTLDGVKVYAHLACPYVQDHQPLADFDGQVAYLKDFFSRRDVREFLVDNKAMLHDYTPYAPELLHLFDLSFL